MAAIARGLALAAPLVVVLTALLASADAVFASFLRFPTDVSSVADHVFLIAFGGWGTAALLRIASSRLVDDPPLPRVRVGTVEANVVVGSLCLLFGSFAIAQVVSVSEGGKHVLETAGLTYAEYARTGFFQLLAVAVITLLTLMTLRASIKAETSASRARFIALAEVAVVLTLLVVAIAIRRLDLYEDVYGLTMLRLYSTIFAVWIGVSFVLLGLDIARVRKERAWFLPAATAVGLVMLFVLNVVNPEAVVARHNMARAARGERFDPSYIADLSVDAVPTLTASLRDLPEEDAERLLERIGCELDDGAFRGWAAFNVSKERADNARAAVCFSSD